MTKFLIKIKPLDTYFFGQEDKYKKKKEGYEADYYQKSAMFPQQTTLFGMLRYYVLLKNKQIPITNKDLASKLIGKKSFDIGTENPDFGTIKKISSVFITDNNNNFYFKNPKNLFLEKGTISEYKSSKANFISNTSINPLFFENYNEKPGLDQFLIHSNSKVLALKDVFIENEKVGIKKNRKGETDDKSFYKQVYYSMGKGYSFGIIAELEGMEEHKEIVSMGAEKSPFTISFEKYEAEVEDQLKIDANNNKHTIVLLSDAYMSDYDTDDFQFALSSLKTFRFLKTEVKTGHTYYSSDPIKSKLITRSKKINLLERGSVFYFENEEQQNNFSDKLKKETNFVQIGYNQHKKNN